MLHFEKIRRSVATSLVLAFCTLAAPCVWADQSDTLKAVFIMNLLKFTEYPASAPSDADTPLVIAAIGNTQFTTTLKAVLDCKIVQKRKVEVRIFRNLSEWKNDNRPCQALFISPPTRFTWSEIRAVAGGRPILTISEDSGFCAEGGMLNLYEQENRIRFEANPGAAEKEGLKLKSELLKLATIVTTKGEQ